MSASTSIHPEWEAAKRNLDVKTSFYAEDRSDGCVIISIHQSETYIFIMEPELYDQLSKKLAQAAENIRARLRALTPVGPPEVLPEQIGINADQVVI